MVLATAAAIFALRYSIAAGYPTGGPDYGHYLIAQNWYALNDHSGEGPMDLPLVPLLLNSLSAFMGRLGALQAAGPMAAASLVPATYFLLTRFVPRWAALLAGATVALWQQFTELITFGGVTNLFGIAISLVVYRVFFDALEQQSSGWRPSRGALASALLLVLLLSTHHLTAFVTGATLVVWVSVRLVLDAPKRRQIALQAMRIFGLASLMGAVYVPYLLALMQGELNGGFGRPTAYAFSSGISGLVFRDTPWIWGSFGVLALGATLVLFRPRSKVLPFAAAVLGTPVLLVVTVLGTHPFRSLLFETAGLVAIAALWSARGDADGAFRNLPLRATRAMRAVVTVLLLVAIPVLTAAVPTNENNGIIEYQKFMIPGTLDAFDWVAQNTSPSAILAVDRFVATEYNDHWKGMATGWWLEGWTNRKALYEADLILLPFLSKWQDARNANRIFSGETVFENGRLRVADNFPVDDGALPRIMTGYLSDYHEFVGFSSPRLLRGADNLSFVLQDAAQVQISRGVADGMGWISGNYSGPGFAGRRAVTVDGANNSVTLELEFSIEAGAPWDALEVGLTLAPSTVADLSGLANRTIGVSVPDGFGFHRERGTVAFSLTNLAAPAAVKAYLVPGERGVGLRFAAQGLSIRMSATFALTQVSDSSPDAAPLTMFLAQAILAQNGVTHLYVGTDSGANLQRFARQASQYVRAFANPAAVIYEVHLP